MFCHNMGGMNAPMINPNMQGLPGIGPPTIIQFNHFNTFNFNGNPPNNEHVIQQKADSGYNENLSEYSMGRGSERNNKSAERVSINS